MAIKGKLDDIIFPEQVVGDYNYLSDKEEIENNGKINIDKWVNNEEKNIENSIINNAEHTLNWLIGLSYYNFPDHILYESEILIFTYALQHGIYTENEINSIVFDHGETKEYYIEKYGTNSQEELLSKLQEVGEEETKKLRKYMKNNPEPKSYLGDCSGTCC